MEDKTISLSVKTSPYDMNVERMPIESKYKKDIKALISKINPDDVRLMNIETLCIAYMVLMLTRMVISEDIPECMIEVCESMDVKLTNHAARQILIYCYIIRKYAGFSDI